MRFKIQTGALMTTENETYKETEKQNINRI